MLIDEQHECMDTLNRIIRSADAFRVAEAADKLIRLIHELLCECGSEQGEQQWIHLFEEGLRKFRAGDFGSARELMKDTAKARGGFDGPSRFYLKEISRLEAALLRNGWTGIVEMTEK